MSSQEEHHLPPHFVLVPFMAPGHFIPMFDIATLLSKRNMKVTFITTPDIVSRLADRVDQPGVPINVATIKFPAVECGLQEGCVTLESVSALEEDVNKFFIGIHMMEQPFIELFRDLKPKPSCIIADKLIPWPANIAREFNTPRIDFDGMSCFTLVLTHCLRSLDKTILPESDSESFPVLGIPDSSIQLNRSQLPPWCDPTHDFTKQMIQSEREAFGVIINSFQALESGYVEIHRKLIPGKRIWCVGPCSSIIDKAHKATFSADDDNQCLKWLDQHQPGSVVYACLGSLTDMKLAQLEELGLGLEASNRPFIWVVRRGNRDQEIDEWLRDDGFQERTTGRGLIVRGWAPQVSILLHPAVGAFLTHCGWNSTLEGVCAGLPMITWPIYGDQFFNDQLLVNVLKIGVSVEAQFSAQVCDKLGFSVKREAVAKAVEKALAGGPEGEERRRKVRSLAEIANKAPQEGGSSYLSLTLLIQDVKQELASSG